MKNLKKNKFADEKAYAVKPVAYYIDNEKFYEACVAHHLALLESIKLGLPPPRISNYVGDCLLKIAKKMATSRHFNRYSFIEDMTMDAVENCLKYFNNFDPVKYKNPFSYFSQVVYYAFLRRIGQERDAIYNQFKMSQQARFELMGSVENVYDDNYEEVLGSVVNDSTDAMNDFVKKYETTRNAKRIKAKAAKKQ